MNVAVTLSALFMVILHVPVPEQAPDQPVNAYPTDAAAVSVTDVPEENEAEQVLGQEIPEGELVTVPVPLTVTDSVSWAWAVMLTAAKPKNNQTDAHKTVVENFEAMRW